MKVENVGQVIKKVGLVLVLCLLTIWLQILAIMALISANPFPDSGIVLILMIFSGLLFCAVLGRLINLLSVKTQAPPPWLKHMALNLASKLNRTVPKLQIVKTEGVNAFAVDNMTRSGHVILHRQVLSSLTHDEVEAILAHEMCHIDKGHAGVLTFMQGAMFPITLPLAFVISGLISSVNSVDKFMQNFLKLNSFFSLILFPFTSVILLIANRSWEYEADACAAKLVGQQQYLHTLRCLHGSFFQHPNLLNTFGNTSVMGHGETNRQKAGLTHPSLTQRINALQEIGL